MSAPSQLVLQHLNRWRQQEVQSSASVEDLREVVVRVAVSNLLNCHKSR
jgi:hypothetical protein